MRALLWTLLCAAAVAAPRKIAVLELQDRTGAADATAYLTDRVRAAALALPRDQFFVMTRENILDQLPPGTDLAECQGDCEVETGRNVGADFVASGELLRLGGEVRVSLKLHETEGGALLATDKASAARIEGLEQPLEQAAQRMFRALGGVAFAVVPPSPLPDIGAAPTAPAGMDFSKLDVGALEAYDTAVKLDRGPGKPAAKADAWEKLALDHPRYKEMAAERAAAWRAYGDAVARATAARERDWAKLARLLKLEVVAQEDKARWAREFLEAYGYSVRENPHAPEVWLYLEPAPDLDLTGTTWSGADSDGDHYVYRFQPGGRLEYTSPTGTFTGATWRQAGKRIYMETNGRYSEYEGHLDGPRITGRAWNKRGHEWTWRAERKK